MINVKTTAIDKGGDLSGKGREAIQRVIEGYAETFRSTVNEAVEERAARIEVRQPDFGFVNGKRYYSPITYTWPDYYNGDNSQWSKFLKFGNSLGIVILNRASGEWLVKRPDTDFATQANLAMAAGTKRIAFYIKTRYGANAPEADEAYRERVKNMLGVSMEAVTRFTEQFILDSVTAVYQDYPEVFSKSRGAIFLDEVVNGWDEQQQKIIPFYQQLYRKIKNIVGNDVPIIINPGSNTRKEMMDACDIVCTWESSAQKYLDPTTQNIHPDHYKDFPSWRFWHVVHGVTEENIEKVFDKLDSLNIGHAYVTDRVFNIGAGSEDSPEGNPYDKAPSAFVETKVRSWTNGILPLENRLAAVEAALKKLQAKEA
jgi:hypothetical protein